MIKTSEYCSVGHPDRMCDYIVSYILDRYLERDRNARVALEAQFKDKFVTLSGEVTSATHFSEEELANFVHAAVKEIGYTDAYRDKWGKGNTISGNDLEVMTHISQQSRDIAQGVDNVGWGDQGIFWGMAVNDPMHRMLPADYQYARSLCSALMTSGVGGLDIKTQVTMEYGVPTEVVVAIPLLNDAAKAVVKSIVKRVIGHEVRLTINGTGRYVVHGPIGDCGTTGRKLVSDFYGGNSRIGGGSPWGKDPTKADVGLNLLARRYALDYLRCHECEEVHCAISCCIGSKRIRISYFNGHNDLLDTETAMISPADVCALLHLTEPRYADRCAFGLFGYADD